jgi:hypothetical protein
MADNVAHPAKRSGVNVFSGPRRMGDAVDSAHMVKKLVKKAGRIGFAKPFSFYNVWYCFGEKKLDIQAY